MFQMGKMYRLRSPVESVVCAPGPKSRLVSAPAPFHAPSHGSKVPTSLRMATVRNSCGRRPKGLTSALPDSGTEALYLKSCKHLERAILDVRSGKGA